MKNKIITKQNIRNLIITGYLIIILWFLGNFFYFFDLMSHFYLQYLFLGIIIFIFSICIKDKVSTIACTLMLLFLWFNVLQTTIVNDKFIWKADCYYLNANYNINSPDEIIKNIREHDPKYIIIVELNQELHDAIKEEFQFNNIVYHSNNISSFGFFTNEVIEKQDIHQLTYPIWEIKTIDWTIFIIHPFPPINGELATMQKQNFEEVKNLFNKNKDTKKMIIWDLNSSYYSLVFKKYFWKLHYTPIYSWWTNWFLRLPIDYAIWNIDYFDVNGIDLDVSDHSPLLINFK